MSEFYKYNPYVEAAAIGGELARGIGELLVNRPREQYSLARQQMQDAMQMQQWQTEQAQNQVMNPLRISLLRAQVQNEQRQPDFQAQRLADAQTRLQQEAEYNAERINLLRAQIALAQHKASQVPNVSPTQQYQSWDRMANTFVPLVASRAGAPIDPKTKDFVYPIDGSAAYGYGAGLLNQGVPPETVMSQLEAVPSLQTNRSWFGFGSPTISTNAMTIRPKAGAMQTGSAQPRQGAVAQPAANMARPQTQEEYDALPSGTIYIDTDGVTKRKK